ncbi:alpha-1,2-fucosyltransferase [Ammoniphilus sp. 3BR4]|uniref:alpha-1,2-fucosyltransferase n=1 Tax=Ammoniphilus sp. 3BR4 TaxID=3158265 RepID=UPI0034666CD0
MSNGIITMNSLGKKGRFGNQVFQYAFLNMYASRYSLEIQTNPWVGQFLFGHQDPPVTHNFPLLTSHVIKKQIRKGTLFSSKTPPYRNVELWGQFMFHTRFYRPHKKLFRSLFQPAPKIRSMVNKGYKDLRKRGETIIGIHIRRGDFLKFKDHKRNVPVPTSWYTKWLDQTWPTLKKPVLFIASDDVDSVLPDFKPYHPVISSDVIKNFPKITSFRPDTSFYPDFYLLTKCDVLAISNSSFSFAASMLNDRCKVFMRPNPKQKLVSYDPWDSDVRVNLR